MLNLVIVEVVSVWNSKHGSVQADYIVIGFIFYFVVMELDMMVRRSTELAT